MSRWRWLWALRWQEFVAVARAGSSCAWSCPSWPLGEAVPCHLSLPFASKGGFGSLWELAAVYGCMTSCRIPSLWILLSTNIFLLGAQLFSKAWSSHHLDQAWSQTWWGWLGIEKWVEHTRANSCNNWQRLPLYPQWKMCPLAVNHRVLLYYFFCCFCSKNSFPLSIASSPSNHYDIFAK